MRVALALPPDDESRLAASAEHHGHAVVATGRGDELALRLAQQPADLLIVASSPTHLTSSLVEAADLLGVRMLVLAADDAGRRHAQRLGIVDVDDRPAGWELIGGGDPRPAIAAATPVEPASARAAAAHPGTVLAVWGPHGAPGRTSVAIALAAELAASGLRVMLVDADTHAASVAPALGLLDEAPGFAAACRLAGIGRLDRAQFDRIAATHGPAGAAFLVLTGIGRAERWPELGEERVAAVLGAAREHVDAVIVDVAASLERDDGLPGGPTSPMRNGAAIAALVAADRVLALAAADPVGVARFLRARPELLALVEAERVSVAVTKVRSSVLGAGAGAQVRQTLARFGGVADAALIPWDPVGFDAALHAARPLGHASPRSAARAAIRELAHRLVPAPEPQRVRRRRGRRIA